MHIRKASGNDLMSNMTYKETVLAWLGKSPKKLIEINGYKQLEPDLGMNAYKIGHAMIQLYHEGVINLHHSVSEGGRKRVHAIELIKSPGSASVYKVAGEKAKKEIKARVLRTAVMDQQTYKLENTQDYIKNKIKIEEAKEKMIAVGFDPAAVSQFVKDNTQINKIAEEAVYLLEINENLRMQVDSVGLQRDEAVIDAQVYREQAEFWKAKVPEATRETLLGIAPTKEKILARGNVGQH